MTVDRLTDETSDIANRLTAAARSWAEPDALSCRKPATELELLLDTMNELNARRLRIAELEGAIRDIGDHVGEFGAVSNDTYGLKQVIAAAVKLIQK